MFCYQCEQTAQGTGCTTIGVCGKTDETATLQDLLVHAAKGIAMYAHRARASGVRDAAIDGFVLDALFTNFRPVIEAAPAAPGFTSASPERSHLVGFCHGAGRALRHPADRHRRRRSRPDGGRGITPGLSPRSAPSLGVTAAKSFSAVLLSIRPGGTVRTPVGYSRPS